MEGMRTSKVCCVSCPNVENKPTRRILSALASFLHRLVARHERLLLVSARRGISRENMCVFSAMQVPVMSIEKYVERIFKHYNNDYFAKVGGLSLAEMNTLEVEFLFMLRFRLQVTVSVFESYCSHFEREVAWGG
ncbi:hypothetical protein KI387_003846, partial [Taxus chinensis]